MGDFWFKLKIWAKTTLFAVLFIYAILFIYNNSGEQVTFWWWFGHHGEHDKLTFGFASFEAIFKYSSRLITGSPASDG